jgi:hypothetical protein
MVYKVRFPGWVTQIFVCVCPYDLPLNHVLHYYCYKPDFLTLHQQKKFSALCKRLVHNWRSYAHWSVSMKLHMFESHLAFLMFEYGNLSQWLEESMEAFHKIMNQKEVQYGNQRDFAKKQASIVRDLAVGSSVQVEGFGGMMNESRRRKNSSDDNVANKLAKTNAEEEQRMERIDRIESSLIL